MSYILLLFSFIITKLTIPLLERFLIKSNCVKENYKGDLIPCSMGIIYVFNILIVIVFLYKYIIKFNDNFIFMYLIGILTMGLVGLIDDLIGNDKVRGFKGHVKQLLNRDLTTGGIKAVFGGIISILISLTISSDFINFITNFLLITLFANLINLLDLRPGRALKGYLLISIFLLIVLNSAYENILLISLGITLAYLPYDLKGKMMLGDIGANTLGITLGIISTTLSLNFKIVLVLFLITIHIYCEKYSLSSLILKNNILRYIDNLGR